MSKAKQYIDQLNFIDEHVTIEAKRCVEKIDRSVLETICSYSNEPDMGGGVILHGIEETQDRIKPYSVVGVKDSDKLQMDLATQCANMFNHPVRPVVETDVVDGKKVIVVTVQELDPRHKPLFFINEGLPRGAWRRIGSTDQRCTEEDMAVFYTDNDSFDKAVAEYTDLEDIDENAVRYYRNLLEKANPDAEELKYSDIDLLRSLRAIVKDKEGEWRLTNAGLIVFGKQMAIRREMPSVRVDYIRVAGTEWLPDPYNRFESIDMRGPLLVLIGRVFNAIADDLPRGFALMPGDLQAKRPLSIPEDALREAIVNSLIHQSLRIHRPIQIIRYTNRIEIINPGFSLKPADTLGQPGSEMRNPTICSIIHEAQIAEAKGTGIGTMRRLMKEAGMMPPTFDSDHSRNQFTTRILLHHFLSEEDVKMLSCLDYELSDNQKTALIFLREVGAIDNLTYRQLSGLSSREAVADVKQIEAYGLIEKHGHGRQSYYTPTDALLHSLTKDASFGCNNASMLDCLSVTLQNKIAQLKKRVPNTELMDLTIQMCSEMSLSIEEIAAILNRTTGHIRNKIISPLVKAKKLYYTISEMIKHPQQKYKAMSGNQGENNTVL